MKKKKSIKQEKIFKNKYALLVIVVLFAFAVLGVNKILGLEINKNTTVCEDKQGNLFVPRDKDGVVDDCGKHGESVTFNFDSGTETGTDGVGMIDDSYALFNFGTKMLTKDGKVWSYEESESGNGAWGWYPAGEYIPINPEVVDMDKIISWNGETFLTSDGDLYVIRYGAWLNVGKPVNPNP